MLDISDPDRFHYAGRSMNAIVVWLVSSSVLGIVPLIHAVPGTRPRRCGETPTPTTPTTPRIGKTENTDIYAPICPRPINPHVASRCAEVENKRGLYRESQTAEGSVRETGTLRRGSDSADKLILTMSKWTDVKRNHLKLKASVAHSKESRKQSRKRRNRVEGGSRRYIGVISPLVNQFADNAPLRRGTERPEEELVRPATFRRYPCAEGMWTADSAQ